MKALRQTELKERDEHAANLRAEYEELAGLKDTVQEALDRFNEQVTKYNDAVSALEGWKGDLVGMMDSYYDEKSEKWQEGDAGTAYSQWKEEWENFSPEELETVEIQWPEEPSTADDLEQLPEQP